MAMDNFIDEIEEELKRDRHLELWRKYGKFAVAAALIVVIAVAAFVGWRQYQANRQAEAGLRYAEAIGLAARGQSGEALAAFKALGDDGPAGYADLARFQQAAIHARQGDEAAAAAVYDSIARDASVDPAIRELALILYALAAADRAEPRALEERLKPLTTSANPWRHSALEVTAILAQRRGDAEGARGIYQRLADDPAAPPGVRARAAEFLAVLGK